MHESDFQLAKTYSLIPSSTTWESWNKLSPSFHDVLDTDVSQRYLFGELRLSRLNFWSKIFLRRMNYFQTRGQTGAFLANFFAPFVYIWATVDVILSAMQLEFSVQQVYGSGNQVSWTTFAAVGRWSSIAILVIAALTISLIFLLTCARYVEQMSFALKDLLRKQRRVEGDED